MSETIFAIQMNAVIKYTNLTNWKPQTHNFLKEVLSRDTKKQTKSTRQYMGYD